jgi:methionyl-tRNA synthetase
MKKFSNFVIYAALTVVLMVLSWTFIANIFVSRPMWGFDYPYFEKENLYIWTDCFILHVFVGGSQFVFL